MSFKQVLSQPHAVSHFQSVLARGRLAHAYVFCGPDGVGKALFARELAKTLLCRSNTSSDKETSPDACDQCKSCTTVDSGDNPDLFWITLDYKVIKIDAVREIERLAVLKPHNARRRVFVIEDAERMNAEAANCLLKTLEEPPHGVVILLTATSLARLPRTIVSRCQVVRFQPIEPAILKKLIKKNLDVFKEGDGDSYKEALEWLAGASCGSMGWAARLVKEEAVTRRKKLFDRLSSLHTDDNFLVSQEVLDWCPYNKDEGLEGRRVRLKIWMCLMLEFYRDVLLCKVGADELGLFNMDYRDKIAAKARQLSERTVEEIMGEINSSLDGLQRNANINLLVENLFTRIARLESNT